jgi:hypothetical protein
VVGWHASGFQSYPGSFTRDSNVRLVSATGYHPTGRFARRHGLRLSEIIAVPCGAERSRHVCWSSCPSCVWLESLSTYPKVRPGWVALSRRPAAVRPSEQAQAQQLAGDESRTREGRKLERKAHIARGSLADSSLTVRFGTGHLPAAQEPVPVESDPSRATLP